MSQQLQYLLKKNKTYGSKVTGQTGLHLVTMQTGILKLRNDKIVCQAVCSPLTPFHSVTRAENHLTAFPSSSEMYRYTEGDVAAV